MNYTLRLRSTLAVGVSIAALFSAAPVLAQTAPAAPAEKSVTTMGEVIVTAEKRSANVQSVPIAVTAFTSKQRALTGINSVQDMTNFTPGLTYSSQLDRPVMRGLARSTNIYAADSSVGVYDNDLFTNSTFLVGRDDMIVDQVEVLLGPRTPSTAATPSAASSTPNPSARPTSGPGKSASPSATTNTTRSKAPYPARSTNWSTACRSA